jgi:hypothetical protein
MRFYKKKEKLLEHVFFVSAFCVAGVHIDMLSGEKSGVS